MNRRFVLSASLLISVFGLPSAAWPQENAETALDFVIERANQLGPLRSVLVSLDGKVVAARGYHGGSPDTSTNIKSASKSIISALVGIAIDKGVLRRRRPEDRAAAFA